MEEEGWRGRGCTRISKDDDVMGFRFRKLELELELLSYCRILIGRWKGREVWGCVSG